MTENKPEEYIGTAEAALMLDRKQITVQKYIQDGIIKNPKKGNLNWQWLIPKSEIERLLNSPDWPLKRGTLSHKKGIKK